MPERVPFQPEIKERENFDGRKMALVLGLLGGVTAFVAECSRSEAPSPGQTVQISESDKQKIQKQIAAVGKLLEQMPANSSSESAESETPVDLSQVDVSSETLSAFPNKDVPPTGSRLVRFVDPDWSSWQELEKWNLQGEYRDIVDNLVVEKDPGSIHLYIPGTEDLNIVLGFEKTVLSDGTDLWQLTDSSGQLIWTHSGAVSLEELQTKVRQDVQGELTDYLKAATGAPPERNRFEKGDN